MKIHLNNKPQIMRIIRGIKNPYPKDIFKPISKKELNKIHRLLQDKIGFPMDRLSGHIGRFVFEGCRNLIIDRIKDEL